MNDENDVPVTRAMLELIDVLQHAKWMFISEELMAKELGMPSPAEAWSDRCTALYFKTYATHAKQIGLALDEITFQLLMEIEVWEELRWTDSAELPITYAFNPRTGLKILRSD